jgi:hypothetical protein
VSTAGVPVVVSAEAICAPEQAFGVIAPIDLSRIFTGYGPLPAVRGVRDPSGPWERIGSSRTVELSDGTTVAETLTSWAAPSHFGYRVGPFGGPLGRLVAHADGAWWFEPLEAGGTRIRWSYVFVPRTTIARPTVRGLAALWRRYSARALAAAVRIAESETSRS